MTKPHRTPKQGRLPNQASKPRIPGSRAAHDAPKPSAKFASSSNPLAEIRRFIDMHGELSAFVGPLARFCVVVDANVLIKELLWLTTKRKNQNAKPELLECLEAETFVVHITPQVSREVEARMATLARRRGFSDGTWRAHWRDYKHRMTVTEPDSATTAKYALGRDPTDAPTLALAEAPEVHGILSTDADIKAMGGKVLPIAFKLEARNYSRRSAIYASLRIGRFYVTVGAVAGLVQIFRSMILAGRAIAALPEWAKLLLLATIVGAALYPKTRQAALKGMDATGSAVSGAGSLLLELLQQVNKEIELHRVDPPAVRHI